MSLPESLKENRQMTVAEVQELMIVVGEPLPPLELMVHWTQATRQRVADYLAYAHSAGSDNAVRKVRRPPCLDAWQTKRDREGRPPRMTPRAQKKA